MDFEELNLRYILYLTLQEQPECITIFPTVIKYTVGVHLVQHSTNVLLLIWLVVC